MSEEYTKKLDKIKKEYKHTDMLLEIYLENYHNNYIYIRLDYFKKEKVHKLSWVDLNYYNGVPTIGYEYIPESAINYLSNIASAREDKEFYPEDLTGSEFLVHITSNFKNHSGKTFETKFNRYLAKTDRQLIDIIGVVFNNLPLKLNVFFHEMSSVFNGNNQKYEYNDEIAFNLKDDDLSDIFSKEIIEKGEKYFKEGRVLFLEKIKERYFAVVGGQGKLYVTIIKYDEETKRMQVYCSCPCEFKCKHILAVILAIRAKKFRKFYKITRRNEDIDLLERIMNFNFLLTIGIDDAGNNYLVIEDGELKVLPVTEDWLILGDDETSSLTKRLKNILKLGDIK